MGRSVRGEKDYSVIIIIGGDLTRLLREKNRANICLPQMDTQIEIGLEIAEMATEEIKDGKSVINAFNGLIQQGLERDNDWKTFYIQEMEAVKNSPTSDRILKTYVAELYAEKAFSKRQYQDAVNFLQTSLDKNEIDRADVGWYLQDMARYQYRANRTESDRLQLAAHTANRLLLLPASSVTIANCLL